ncbi:MAG: aldehyde dehydrogenase family protein, partial [Acidovorax sp.]|nr:aldehyde dehydrogenase family protein [Acidovorax sp.]
MTPADIHAHFDLQRQASRAHVDVPLLVRRERLLRISKMLNEHGPVLAAAVQADFGMRSPRLTEVADFFVLRTLLSHTLSHLARWMKPRKVRTPIFLQPASAHIQRQPLGVVGVIAPWNYPVQLALAPAITALAAGNRVMLKPSELTPHTSVQLALLVAQFFSPDEFCVVQGDANLSALFASLPFDHLVFTGSTAVGRKVAQAAAQ